MSYKSKIESFSNNISLPYENLVPLVQVLVEDGNRVLGSSQFVLEKDGWSCYLRNPINFRLLEERFVFPSSVKLSPEYNSILDQNSWVEIKGGIGKR